MGRTRPLAAALLCCLVTAAGCSADDEEPSGAGNGGADAPSTQATTAQSSTAEAEAALHSFFTALIEGDAAAACGLLSEQGLRYVEEGALTSSPSGGGECEEVVVDSYGSPDQGLLEGFEVVATQRSTDGSVRLTFRNGDTAITAAKNAVLRKEGGEWKVDSAGVLGG